uniref:SDR family NAD(P)-dependent oxidoreductase n=1 Tax=Bacillus sp. JCM 19041 TaxID=1460637 RepID=UPI000A91235A
MRHALITAGTKGLGLKVTEALIESGYSVTVTYFSDEQQALKLQEKWGKGVLHLVQADVTKKD